MKKFWTLALTLVLTAALFTGCGCTNSEKNNASTPTGMTESMPTILPTQAPTVPTTQATRPTTEATMPTGNGSTEDSSGGATESTDVTEGMQGSRGRTMIPGSDSGSGNNTSGR